MTELQCTESEKGLPLLGIHHVAIIASDYKSSKRFYVELLGCTVIAEHFREQRKSYKLDLGLPDGSQLELFSFPDPPPRVSRPEACGLCHLAFKVDNVDGVERHMNDRYKASSSSAVNSAPGRFLPSKLTSPSQLLTTRVPNL